MKKFFTLFNICMIACILFASCGSHVTVKKRLYSKGFYISGGNNKSNGSDVIDESNESTNKSIDKSRDYSSDYTSKLTVKSNEDNSTIETLSVLKEKENENYFLKSNEKKSITTERKDKISNNEVKYVFSKNFTSKLQFKNLENKNFLSKGMKDTSEGLSLFWLVILILLILWAIGYFGTSIGALINLLLLVALILLILWLLRVI